MGMHEAPMLCGAAGSQERKASFDEGHESWYMIIRRQRGAQVHFDSQYRCLINILVCVKNVARPKGAQGQNNDRSSCHLQPVNCM